MIFFQQIRQKTAEIFHSLGTSDTEPDDSQLITESTLGATPAREELPFGSSPLLIIGCIVVILCFLIKLFLIDSNYR